MYVFECIRGRLLPIRVEVYGLDWGGGLCLIGLHGGDNYPLQSGLFRINRRNSTAVYRVSKHFKLLLTYFDFFSFILVIIHFMTWQKFMTFSLADDL